MPYAPANPCRVPMCPNMQPCPEHVPRDLRRGRGYGRRWRNFRDAWYRRHGRKCVLCLAEGIIEPATELDHIVPLTGPDDPTFFDDAAVQGLCGPCHKRKTARERREGIIGG